MMTFKVLVRSGVILLTAIALVSCAHNKTTLGGDPTLKVVEGNTLPIPSRADSTTSESPYYIGPFDKLQISVFGIDELNKVEVQTDASGRISFPLAGVVEAAGRTPAELETLLTERLRANYVRNPQVTVNLKETVSQVVTVEGQVTKPGLYPVVGKMTLLRAVATAQGTTEFAKLEDVVIFRTVKGQDYGALYNMKAIQEGKYSDPEVYANDVVVVGDSNARRVFKNLIPLIANALAAPIIVIFQKL
ncbi:MAG: polysaccharide export protein [Alphaproteobacteria bacterium]|nr:polysaccharide export protein [Alphaproteobacteria bacterium]MDE2341078.1 polysaccharide export protein [Alphaproteobacteria bacterium]